MRFAVAALLLGVHPIWAAEGEPLRLPPEISVHVPAGWKSVAFATGDLNADRRNDFVLVCDDLDYVHVEDGTDGWPRAENRTRAMYVYFAAARGYVLQGRYHTLPYGYHFNSVSISRGIMKIRLYNCIFDGGWYSEEEYKYRLERGRFRLIGFDFEGGSRMGTARTSGSTNYLTSFEKFREVSAYHPDLPFYWYALPPRPALFLEDGFREPIGR